MTGSTTTAATPPTSNGPCRPANTTSANPHPSSDPAPTPTTSPHPYTAPLHHRRPDDPDDPDDCLYPDELAARHALEIELLAVLEPATG